MAIQPDIRISSDDQWADSAAQLIQEISEQTVRLRDHFFIALSGGSTPRRLYDTLTGNRWNRRFPWQRMIFFFGDERCVPPDHPESNYGMAQTALFRPLHIDSRRIHRIKGESEDAASAAREYEETIRQVTKCPSPSIPQFDLVLLGLGDDGHTASLFPNAPELRDYSRLITVSHSPKGIACRLTMTLGVINRASVIVFLVAGSAKAQTVRRVLEPHAETEERLPACLVKPDHGRLIWHLDQSAASALTHVRPDREK